MKRNETNERENELFKAMFIIIIIIIIIGYCCPKNDFEKNMFQVQALRVFTQKLIAEAQHNL